MANVYKRHNWKEINVSASVGKDGANVREDVAVIQAMLKYALEWREYFKGDRFPEPTGMVNADTLYLIEKYQRYLRHKSGMKISVDGRIDPARGERAFGSNGQWTIQALNGEVLERFVVLATPGDNYIHALSLQYPQVRRALGGNVPVGTLSLTLESKPEPVGTLDLGLE